MVLDNMKRFFLLLLICTAVSAPCTAQRTTATPQPTTDAEPDLSQTGKIAYHYKIDSKEIMLGDQTVLAIEKTPLYPSLDDLSTDGIVAVRQWMDTSNGTLYTALTSFEPGEHWLHIGSDSLLLKVNDVANVDTTSTEIRDIADIMNQPYTLGEIARTILFFWLFWALVAAAVLIVVRIKKRKPLISLPKTPPLPPDTRALERLEALRRQGLWQKGMVKEYYTELTDSVRVYLEESYGIQSTEMTTGQTLEAFKSAPVCNEDTSSILSQILNAADMVKFAKSMPQPYQHDLALDQAQRFVKTTAEISRQTETPESENIPS